MRDDERCERARRAWAGALVVATALGAQTWGQASAGAQTAGASAGAEAPVEAGAEAGPAEEDAAAEDEGAEDEGAATTGDGGESGGGESVGGESVGGESDGGESDGGESGGGAGPEPVQRTLDSRVVNEQQEDLEREQREVMDEEEREVSLITAVEEEESPYRVDNRDHANMVSLRVGVHIPYRLTIKYANGPRCDQPDPTDPVDEAEQFCNDLAEPLLDLELGYAVTSTLAITAFASLALDEDPVANATPRQFGVGLRGYTSEDAIVKGFFGARVIFDYTKSDLESWSNFDAGLRGEVGLQIDALRWLGFYVGGAVTVRLFRGFTFLPEAGGGIQVRFP